MEWRNPNGVVESQWSGGIRWRIPVRRGHLEWENPERNPTQQADGGIPEDPKGRIPGEIAREEPRHTHFLLRGNVPDPDNPREDTTGGSDTTIFYVICELCFACAI